MRKLLTLIGVIFILTGCVHKMDIEQGNMITDDMVRRLHTGMSEQQVYDLMGAPVLINTFDDKRKDYVYSFKAGRGQMTEKYITLDFRNGRLQAIGGNLYSAYIR